MEQVQGDVKMYKVMDGFNLLFKGNCFIPEVLMGAPFDTMVSKTPQFIF